MNDTSDMQMMIHDGGRRESRMGGRMDCMEETKGW